MVWQEFPGRRPRAAQHLDMDMSENATPESPVSQPEIPEDESSGSLRREAYEQIIAALMTRQIRTGRLVSQREIARTTGCSLSSIREALKWLEAENIVRLIPKRGVEFHEVTRKEVAESYELRMMIELKAIEAFALQVDPARIEAFRLETRALIDEQKGRTVGPDHTVRRIETDHALHREIVAALGNDLIAEMHRRNETIMLLARLSLPPALLETGPALEEHMAILDCLATGDSAGAASALESHLASARDRALQALVV